MFILSTLESRRDLFNTVFKNPDTYARLLIILEQGSTVYHDDLEFSSALHGMKRPRRACNMKLLIKSLNAPQNLTAVLCLIAHAKKNNILLIIIVR